MDGLSNAQENILVFLGACMFGFTVFLSWIFVKYPNGEK